MCRPLLVFVWLAAVSAHVAIAAEVGTACGCDESACSDSADGNRCCAGLCDKCDCFNDRRRLLGMLPSDHCFDSFISPISNPFFFEDPRSLTEVRGIFLENSLPTSVGNGDAVGSPGTELEFAL